MSEADTRAKLIDPAIHGRGWTDDLIKREERAGAIEIVGEQPRKRRQGRTDYTLRVRVSQASQPMAVALIEAKAERLPMRSSHYVSPHLSRSDEARRLTHFLTH